MFALIDGNSFYCSCERAPAVEPYSIDEMFMDFAGISDMPALSTDIRS